MIFLNLKIVWRKSNFAINSHCEDPLNSFLFMETESSPVVVPPMAPNSATDATPVVVVPMTLDSEKHPVPSDDSTSDSSDSSDEGGAVAPQVIQLSPQMQEPTQEKVKRAAPGSGKKSYPEMVKDAFLENTDNKGITHQTIRKYVQGKVKVTSSRFHQNVTSAIQKLVDDKTILKNGLRYKLTSTKGAKMKQEFKLKKQKLEDRDFKLRLKQGKVSQEELDARKQEEEARKLKAEKVRERRLTQALKTGTDISKIMSDALSTTGKNLPPTAVPPKSLAIIPSNHFISVTSVAEFCSEYSKLLSLSPFTGDMLYNALISPKFTSLIREIHLSLLKVLLEQNGRRDTVLLRLDWVQMLTPATWQEILRRYIVRAISHLGPAFHHFVLLEECSVKLSESSYATLALEQKLAILHLLIDDCYECPQVLADIDKKVELRQELNSTKFQEETAERLKLNEFKDELKKVAATDKTEANKSKCNLDSKIQAIHEKKKERNVQFQRDLLKHRLRVEAYGQDDLENSVWSFMSDPYHLYIRGKGLRGEVPVVDTWRTYDTMEDYETFQKSLDIGSSNERRLGKTLETHAAAMTKRIHKTTITPVDEEEERNRVDEELAKKLHDEEEEAINDTISKNRPKRGAAETAGKLIKGSSSPARFKKSWDDRDPMSFTYYRNLRNDVHGQELSLDDDNADVDQSNPLMQLYVKDAERADIMARLLKRDFGDLADYIEENEGNIEGERAAFNQAVDKAFEGFTKEVKLTYRVSEESRVILTSLALSIEKCATETILAKKKKNARQEVERKERIRLVALQKKELEKMRKAQRHARQRKASLKRKKKSRNTHSKKKYRNQDEDEFCFTSSGRATKRVVPKASRRNNNSSTSEEESDSDVMYCGSSSSDEAELEDGGSEDKPDSEEDSKNKAETEEREREDELINEELDVPDDEKARVGLYQVKERLFPVGAGIRIEAGELLNGKVASFQPVSFISLLEAVDMWEVLLEDGQRRLLDEDDMQMVIDARWYWDKNNKDKGIDGVHVGVVIPQVDESVAHSVRNLWGSFCERNSWLKSIELAQTIGAWSCVAQQLMNRVYVNNSLRQ